jgi:hypothetical protein
MYRTATAREKQGGDWQDRRCGESQNIGEAETLDGFQNFNFVLNAESKKKISKQTSPNYIII